MPRGITKVVACRLEAELADELEQLAAEAGKPVGVYLRDLIETHVHGGGALSGGDSAQNAGYRRAYHEARMAIQQALSEMWPRRRS